MRSRKEFEDACRSIADQRDASTLVNWWTICDAPELHLTLRTELVAQSVSTANCGVAQQQAPTTPPTAICGSTWADDSDSEVLPQSRPTSPTSSPSIEVTYYVTWSDVYLSPVLYFTALATYRSNTDSQPMVVKPTVHELQCWRTMPGISDPVTQQPLAGDDHSFSYGRLIVSEGFSEELQRALFSVHPCDMATMMQMADDVLGPPTPTCDNDSRHHTAAPAASLSRLLRLCGPHLGIPPESLPC